MADPQTMSHQDRRDPLPTGYQFGHASRFHVYLKENIRSGRFPFTPQGIAACIDDAVGRAVYEDLEVELEREHAADVRAFDGPQWTDAQRQAHCGSQRTGEDPV